MGNSKDRRLTETVSFGQDTAKKTGKTERAIRNHAKIGKELSGVRGLLSRTVGIKPPARIPTY